jgi:hypothetical protein
MKIPRILGVALVVMLLVVFYLPASVNAGGGVSNIEVGFAGNSSQLTVGFNSNSHLEVGFAGNISNVPVSKDYGIVQPSTAYWAGGAEPSWPLEAADCWGNLTNNSSFAVDISASMTNMIGGTTWTIGSSPGTNVFTIKIGIAGKANVGNFTTLSNTPVAWITSMVAGNMTRWTMVFYTPTNSPQFADGVPKSGNMTFEAEAS